MKHYRIVNKFRFVTFITIMILLISFMSVGLFGMVFANSKAEEPKYTEVEVVYGDTLWNLAERYGNPNKDVREVIFNICKVNNINANDLKVGQIILIPEK